MGKKEWQSDGNVWKDHKNTGVIWRGFAICMGWIVFVLWLVLAGCTSSQADDKIAMHPAIRKFLQEQQINKSAILSLGDYSDISYRLEVPEVTEEEIEAYEKEEADLWGVKEFTLDFIKENFDLPSYEEYRKYCAKRVFSNKKDKDQRKCEQKILDRLVERAAFDLDQEEVANYSLEKIVEEHEDMAFCEGLPLEEYCEQELQMSLEDFFDMCYQEGEQDVKRYLVMGALAGREYGDVTEEMLLENMDDEYAESDMEWCYHDLEFEVYKLFIHTEEGYWLSEYTES